MMFLFQLVASGLLAVTVQLMPSRGADDLAYRAELVAAVMSVTDDLQEQALLVGIPRWESSYLRSVGECRRKGPQGELGAWQILARNDAERAALCVSLEGDARVALRRLRESLEACAASKPSERLAVYTRGSCSSVEGRRLSRVRWVTLRGAP